MTTDIESLPLALLPLDTPDDDPAWAGFVAQSQLGFLEPEATDEQVAAFREVFRADASRLQVVHDPGAGLSGQPVATYSSFDKRYNVGGGRTVPANLVSEVTVRATHRRRGLLRRMMLGDLAGARERGAAVALLTASEATIYGRFGFAPVNRSARLEVDTRRFALRRPAAGRVDVVTRERAAEAFEAVTEAALVLKRGEFSRPAAHVRAFTGQVAFETGEPDKAVRTLVHWSDGEEPVVDGVARYAMEPRSHGQSQPATAKVRIEALTPEAELALWDFLAHLDLVERLVADVPEGHFLPWAVTDSRCVRQTRVEDVFWARVLDVPALLSARAWDADGDLALGVRDDLGYAEGTWRVEVRDGRAQVTRSTEAPGAVVEVGTLAQLACGGIAPAELVAAGLVEGCAAAQDTVSRLFAVREVLACPWGF